MSIYSNDNIRKIAKLTTRELPHLVQKRENKRENNGLYSILLINFCPFHSGFFHLDKFLCLQFICMYRPMYVTISKSKSLKSPSPIYTYMAKPYKNHIAVPKLYR